MKLRTVDYKLPTWLSLKVWWIYLLACLAFFESWAGKIMNYDLISN